MLFGIVGNATIEVRGKLDGAFSSVIDGTEAINEETKSLVGFLPFPFGNRLFQECGIEFEELKKVQITVELRSNGPATNEIPPIREVNS